MLDITGNGRSVIITLGEREHWGQVIPLLEPYCRIGAYPVDARSIAARQGVQLPLTYTDIVEDLRGETRLRCGIGCVRSPATHHLTCAPQS